MRDRFEGLAVFIETVEAGGFARAGERLALSRSAVGKAIARLEARLGVRLFQRTTRALSLTEDGQAYYERCQRALHELHAGQALLESGKSEVIGALRISMPVLFGRHRIAPILMRLAARHPKLELDLRFSDLVVDVIGEGFDLAVRQGPIVAGAGLRMRKLTRQKKIICAAPSYLERRGAPGSSADLSEHEALVYWRNNQVFPWQLRRPDGTPFDCRVSWRLKFDNLEAIVDAALAGMGIAHLPDWLIEEPLASGRLVPLLVDEGASEIETSLVWPDRDYMPMRLRMTIDALVRSLQRSSSPSSDVAST